VEKEMQEARRGEEKERKNENIYDPGRCPSLRKDTE